MPEGSTAWVLHKAYTLTPLLRWLSPICSLWLSLRISSAQHPFLLGLIHCQTVST